MLESPSGDCVPRTPSRGRSRGPHCPAPLPRGAPDGAVLTAALFTAGRIGLGWYLGREGGDSAYAAAASLLALLAWVYYSSQLVLFGAEFTYAYASRCGSRCPDQAQAP